MKNLLIFIGTFLAILLLVNAGSESNGVSWNFMAGNNTINNQHQIEQPPTAPPTAEVFYEANKSITNYWVDGELIEL